jgi:poly-gamma-glutamate synthesis protein (capsule biosynthesis protein)
MAKRAANRGICASAEFFDSMGLRPYVYELGSSGLIANWRGLTLAWLLIDAILLPGEDSLFCALHRGDSFITLNPETKSGRITAYR